MQPYISDTRGTWNNWISKFLDSNFCKYLRRISDLLFLNGNTIFCVGTKNQVRQGQRKYNFYTLPPCNEVWGVYQLQSVVCCLQTQSCPVGLAEINFCLHLRRSEQLNPTNQMRLVILDTCNRLLLYKQLIYIIKDEEITLLLYYIALDGRLYYVYIIQRLMGDYIPCLLYCAGPEIIFRV